MPFFLAHSAYFNVLQQKVPYFNVSRQNRVVFNRFTTKQCWGMLKMCVLPPWLSPVLSGSLWLSLARCPALFWLYLVLAGYLWLAVRPSGRLITKERLAWPHIFSMRQHCFVAKHLYTTLFCRETLKYATFCRETLKYGTFGRET